MNSMTAMKQYQQVGLQSGVMDASPHQLIQMLMEGVLEKMSLAKGGIKRSDTQEKSLNISKAVRIINGLKASLDAEQGGELAANLNDLYEYMILRLTKANIENDVEVIDEVYGLMSEIKESWGQIPLELHTPS